MSLIAKRNPEIQRRLSAAQGKFTPGIIFRDDEGAIDLASIMVGVLVIGIIAGVIAATVFAVIPWSQDNAAKQALGAVSTAESVQYAQSAGNGASVYGDTSGAVNLTTNANASLKPLLQSSAKISIKLTTNATEYIAVSKSDTGTDFYSFSDNPSTVLNAADALTQFNAGDYATNGITALPTL
ncbi:MAG: hypothetical protein JWM49_639 [Microbacteriaceae bacterium]|nr:hypothetical protein [Microbacteriaceae bacterium]